MCFTSKFITVMIVAALCWSFEPLPASSAQTDPLNENGNLVAIEQTPAIASNRGAPGKQDVQIFDFEKETVGAAPQTFVPVVGNWLIGQENGNRVLVVDGKDWTQGQPAPGIADRAHSLYPARYAEFLHNVQSVASFPYAVASTIDEFNRGEITLRFQGIDGKIDQAAGILFNLQANGDYLALRANPLENNLVLWKFARGTRSSLKEVRNTSTPTRQWHEMKLVVTGAKIEGYINGRLYLTHTLPEPVSGRFGIWSKADSVVYFDDYTVRVQR